MDIPRILYIGAIVALSFTLLTKWVDFKAAHTPAATAEDILSVGEGGNGAMAAIDSGAIDNGVPDSGAVPSGPADDDGDIPVVTEAAPVEIPNEAITANGQLISLRTDVLELIVDLRGGDVVQSALPAYPARLEEPGKPMLLLEDGARRSYVAQSGLVGRNGIDRKGRAQFTSPQTRYALAEGEDQLVAGLHHRADGINITKRFTLNRSDYLLRVEYLIDNRSKQRWQGNLFGQVKRDASPDPSRELSSGMGMAPFLGVALTQPDDRFTKFDFEDIQDDPFRDKLPGGWIAMLQHYFLSAWIPNPNQTHTYSTRETSSGFYIGGFVAPSTVIDPGKSGTVGAGLYLGPKDQYRLEEISEYLDLSVDYGWLWWLAQPLFWLLINIYEFTGNWGIAIILLTVLIKAAFFQLSATSYRSMANMRRVQPKMVDIRERYADDRQKQSQAMMELYRKEKINPLGGCLPILVQMPVFIALYWVLMESVELRQAPFYGWIKDLSVMDPYFILPLLMGASMWFQQRLNPPPPDPMQAKIMQWLPVIFTFFFLWFPSGLVLYWVSNNLLSIAQQWVITRQIEKAG